MTLSIAKTIQGSTNRDDPFNDQLWLRTLETLLPTIRSNELMSMHTIEPATALKYRGDFYGLLQQQGLGFPYHWVTMRLNGYDNPVEFEGDRQILLMPVTTFIDEQRRIYTTLYRKNT